MAKSRKLPLVKRETKKQRSVSFTKRRHGLFNKAAELFMLCDARLAVLVSSPCYKTNRKFYSFGHPSVDLVLDAFLENRVPEPIDPASRQRALSLLQEIKELESDVKAAATQQRNKSLETMKRDGFSSIFEPFENSQSIEELRAVVDGLEKLVAKAKIRVNEGGANNNRSSSALALIDVSCYNNIENDTGASTSKSVYETATPSTSISFSDNDLFMLEDSIFGNDFDMAIVLASDNGGDYEEAKGELIDGNIVTDPEPNYFGNVNYYNNIFDGSSSNSQQVDGNWSLTNTSISFSPDMDAAQQHHQSQNLEYASVDALVTAASDPQYWQLINYEEDFWSKLV